MRAWNVKCLNHYTLQGDGLILYHVLAAPPEENPALSVEIENKVRDAMGIPLLPTGEAEEAAPAKKPRAAKEQAAQDA